MRTQITLLLVATLAAAGCVSSAPEEADALAAGTDTAGTAASANATGPERFEGESTFAPTGVCVPIVLGGACAGLIGWERGTFDLEGNGTGVLQASWEPTTPLQGELTIFVNRGEERVADAQGTSPLTLELPALERGEYEVGVWFHMGSAGPMEQTVQWAVDFTPA